MEDAIISGITHTTDEAYVTLTDVPDKPGTAASIFNAVAAAHINVDTIIQNAVTHGDADVTFSIPTDDLPLMTDTIEHLCRDLGLQFAGGRHGRQGEPDRRRHEEPPGRGRQDVPDAGRARHQRAHDRDLADQGVLRDPPRQGAEAVSELHEAFRRRSNSARSAQCLTSKSPSSARPARSGPRCCGCWRSARSPRPRWVPFASARSAGKRVAFAGSQLEVRELTADVARRLRPGAVLGRRRHVAAFAPEAVARGCVVIDKSSGFRMDPQVPLVVPEVNPDATDSHNGIVANPNCSTIQFVVCAEAAARRRPRRAHVSRDLPGVSGHGHQGDRRARLADLGVACRVSPSELNVYPHQIAFNVLPHCDVFDDDENTEETKLVRETRKILGDDSIAHLRHLRASAGLARALRGRLDRDRAAALAGRGPRSSWPRRRE